MDTVVQSEFSPLTKLAKAAVLSSVLIYIMLVGSSLIYLSWMQRITIGRLMILCSENTYIFPSESSENGTQSGKHGYTAELRVVKDTFWVRIIAMGDLGFAEAYMYGDVECDDLISLFRVSSQVLGWHISSSDNPYHRKIFLENQENLKNDMVSKFSFLFSLPQKIIGYGLLNTIDNARSNISAHYDISNAMFAGKFTATRMY